MNSAIIVAAGAGSRFGGDVPKQFVDVCGRPLLEHTLEKFQICDGIEEIVLVLSADAIASFASMVDTSRFPKLTCTVSGGDTRAESVRNGLAAVDRKCRIVAVHDGARPLVSTEEIERVLAKANETGAACLVAPVTDTIKTVRGEEIAATLERANLRRALTPQAFRIEVLRRAFETGPVDATVTDECYLVEKAGHPVYAVEGSARNIKVTKPDDLTFVRAILGQVERTSN